ncbi:MAG: hypothetical protein M3378_09065 [Actinomycetota bacterium]|nr:hypothetical protein [Actinomycetota bacterium]
MTRLDEREQRITRWAAAVAAVAAVTLYAPAFSDHVAAVVLALLGVVMAGLLALASRSGSRLLTCLAAAVLGIGPWGFAYIIGLPFMVLATWLLFRGAKARGLRTPTVRERRERHKRIREKPSRERPSRERPSKPGAAKPSRPGPNKRYTPPGGRA